MIVTCPNCTTRLQLDDAKLPSRPFSVRCPKCQQIINAQPPTAVKDGSAVAVGSDLPASTRSQREMSVVPAPVFKSDARADEAEEEAPAPSNESAAKTELARVLAALLEQGGEAKEAKSARRGMWERRRALVCLGPVHAERVAQGLAEGNYEVYVAEDTAQAFERMREDKMDVVVLDSEFDVMEQGAAFINRELSSMRPAERRRIVFVQLSPTARTSDTHAAFLANANLVVNTSDVAQLPQALQKTFRDTNELYRDFYKALNQPEL